MLKKDTPPIVGYNMCKGPQIHALEQGCRLYKKSNKILDIYLKKTKQFGLI